MGTVLDPALGDGAKGDKGTAPLVAAVFEAVTEAGATEGSATGADVTAEGVDFAVTSEGLPSRKACTSPWRRPPQSPKRKRKTLKRKKNDNCGRQVYTFRMRPCGPEAETKLRSIPFSFAILRTAGVVRI